MAGCLNALGAQHWARTHRRETSCNAHVVATSRGRDGGGVQTSAVPGPGCAAVHGPARCQRDPRCHAKHCIARHASGHGAVPLVGGLGTPVVEHPRASMEFAPRSADRVLGPSPGNNARNIARNVLRARGEAPSTGRYEYRSLPGRAQRSGYLKVRRPGASTEFRVTLRGPRRC